MSRSTILCGSGDRRFGIPIRAGTGRRKRHVRRVGFGFGAGINVGFYFGGGWHGWGGWGWHPGWGNHTVIVNNTFIHQYNFNASHLANAHGSAVWEHDPAHRAGVPYARPGLNNRYRDNVRQAVAPRSIPQAERMAHSAQPERFGNRDIPRNAPQSDRGVFGGMEHGSAAATHAEHGNSSLGAGRELSLARRWETKVEATMPIMHSPMLKASLAAFVTGRH